MVVLQLTFIGALEFDKRRIWFFASLFESRILFITLDGEMGLLMDFSDNPNFVLSVGGFHPRFTPPPLPFPSPKRLALSLVDESYARVRVETYFAITTNTVQIGARAEAFFGFDALSVEGYFGFDALLRFSPFYLIVEISTGFSVKVFGMGVFGVHLRGSLEGPTPWHITGSASIELPVLQRLGRRRRDLRRASRRDAAAAARCCPRSARPSSRSSTAGGPPCPAPDASSSACGSSATPACWCCTRSGSLQVSQRFIPLNLPLDKVGNQKPSDITKATVSVDAGGVLAVRGPQQRTFAAAQYRDMDDAAKLSAPAFELFESGVELRCGGQRLGDRSVDHPQRPLRDDHRRHRLRAAHDPSSSSSGAELFAHFVAGAAIAKSDRLAAPTEKRHQPFAAKVGITGDRFVVASQIDNTALGGVTAFGSHAEATAHLAGTIAADPTLADTIHVIPLAEVNAAHERRSRSPRTRSCRGPARGSAARCRRPTRRDRARHPRHDRRDADNQRRQDRRRHDVRADRRATSSCTALATSSGSTPPASSAPSRATGSPTSRPTTCRSSSSTRRTSPGATRRRSPSDGGRRMRPWLTLVVLDRGRVRRPSAPLSGRPAARRRGRPTRPARSPTCGRRCGRGPTSTSTALSAVIPTDHAGNAARLGCDGRRQPRLGLLAAALPAHPPRQHGVSRVRGPDVRDRPAGRARQGPRRRRLPDPGRMGRRPDRRRTPTSTPSTTAGIFRTGAVGDFEYLVRLLEPRTVDPRVGRRPIDVQDPGVEPAGDSPSSAACCAWAAPCGHRSAR